MPIISTHTLSSSTPLSSSRNNQVYCGLDSMLTLEILSSICEIHPGAQSHPIYSFARSLQAPYLEIMQRGFAVDESARRRACEALRVRLVRLDGTRHIRGKLKGKTDIPGLLQIFSQAVAGVDLNARSPKQLKEFFYTQMRIPEVKISQKGVRKVSTNREALEKISDKFLHARPIVSTILAIRDIGKQLSVFESEIDPPNGRSPHPRFRSSYNIAGTESGRPSSSENAFGTGTNAQNLSPALRYVFCSDPGHKICSIDLEQVEARDVGWFCGCLFEDWKFLDNCEAGDLHTSNAKLIWPELPWTGDLKQDRKIAEQPFYRDFSFRDMAKRGSHLTNYSGTAWTAARSLKVPLPIMEEFQARYCRGGRDAAGRPITPAYPALPRWWQWTAEQLQTRRQITTPFGRTRQFFGRPDDPATLREAIAFLPQSTTADRMNLGLWRVWKYMPEVQLLAQTYDSITFQFPEELSEPQIVSRALDLIKVELHHPSGRVYVVPGEAKVGWNWGNVSEKNPLGLMKWKPGWEDQRKRGNGLLRVPSLA